MKIVPVAEMKADFSVYLDVCATEGPVIITREGKVVAVLLAPLDDDDLERLVLARSPRFQALLDQSRQSIQAGKGLSRAEFWEAVRQRQQQPGQGAVSVDMAG
jgi:prevent-host-death family protein